MALSAFQCGRGTVPEDLIGVWETKSPAYADRFFEIQAKEIIFGTGEGRFDVYPITKIRIEKEKESKTKDLISHLLQEHRRESIQVLLLLRSGKSGHDKIQESKRDGVD
jgi:hypothetical protein